VVIDIFFVYVLLRKINYSKIKSIFFSLPKKRGIGGGFFFSFLNIHKTLLRNTPPLNKLIDRSKIVVMEYVRKRCTWVHIRKRRVSRTSRIWSGC
jgi:hypothetical protein